MALVAIQRVLQKLKQTELKEKKKRGESNNMCGIDICFSKITKKVRKKGLDKDSFCMILVYILKNNDIHSTT